MPDATEVGQAPDEGSGRPARRLNILSEETIGQWRFYAAKRAPYYNKYIYRFKYVAAPGSGRVRLGKDWTLHIDPEFTVGEAWRMVVWTSHVLAMGYLDSRLTEDRDPEDWAKAVNLSVFQSWRQVMEREDTLATYPTDGETGYPQGVVGPEELGLPPNLTPAEYYDLIHEDGEGQGRGADAQQAPSGSESETQEQAVAVPGEAGDEGGAEAPGDPAGAGQDGGGQEQSQQQPAGTKEETDGQPSKGEGKGEGDQQDQESDQDGSRGGQGQQPKPHPLNLEDSELPQDRDNQNLQQDAKNEAQKYADGLDGGGVGDLPGDLRTALEPKPPAKTPIERRLAQLTGSVKAQLDYMYGGRPSPRTLNHPDGVISPKLAKGMPTCTCVVDVSGSMGDEKVAQAIALCMRAAKATQVHIVFADTTLDVITKKVVTPADIRRMRERRTGGGTDMVGSVREARKTFKDEAIFCVTDGIFNWAGAERLKQVIWAVIPHSTATARHLATVPQRVRRNVIEIQPEDLGRVA